MSPDTVQEQLSRVPFLPLQIATSDGRILTVTDPRSCIVSQDTVYLGIRSATVGPQDVVLLIDPYHIVSIQTINTKSPSSV